MADPIVSYLPQLSQVLGGATPAPVAGVATPLQRALVNNGVQLPALTAAQLQASFNAQPRVIAAAPAATPSSPVVTNATPAAAPAAPVAPPATAPTTSAGGVPNNGAVSPTPGAGNPLPPALRGTDTGTTPLPFGPIGGAPSASATSALAGLPPPPRSGAGAAAAATPGSVDSGGPEVIRAGNIAGLVGGGQYIVPGGGGIRDPQAAIYSGFDAQTARAQHFIDQAMGYVNAGGNIFERATRARFVNGLLATTVGPNNVGQVIGQGQDTLNSSLAGVESAGIGANASEYAAGLGFQENAARIAAARTLQSQQVSSQPVVIGQRQVKNALGLPVMEPIYGLPTLNEAGQATGYRTVTGNGMVVTPQSPPEPANPAVGTTRTRASGAVERFDGKTWVREQAQ